MTKTCNHHFLVNQEKGEKYVFRKSKKIGLYVLLPLEPW
ncbi:agglutinin receptor [Streptococcus suis]|nr:agglutinin receptor [Streptococcus suis]